MSKTLRVAAAQIAVTGNIKSNTHRIVAAIRRAAQRGAQGVVLPECALSGYPPADWPASQTVAATVPVLRAALVQVREAARANKIFVMVGSVRRARGRAYNCTYAINPAGRVVATYDKLQLVQAPGADASVFAGGRRIPQFRIGRTRCAMQICMDSRYPENYRHLKSRGTQVVFQSFYAAAKGTDWKRPVLEATLRCRSAENGFFLVAANVAHPHTSMFSHICDANGRSLAAARSGKPQLLVADLELDQPHGHFYEARRTDLWDLAPATTAREGERH